MQAIQPRARLRCQIMPDCDRRAPKFSQAKCSPEFGRAWQYRSARIKEMAKRAAIVGSVLSGHIEASNRVLGMLSLSEHLGKFPAADLNRLRLLTERRTDLLLGRLGKEFDFAAVAHDPARTQDFADDFEVPSAAGPRMTAWSLLGALLLAAFGPKPQFKTDNADLNKRIAASILACFPADLFDSLGVYHSLWLTRLANVATDAQLVVDQFLAEDGIMHPANSSNGVRRIGRMNRNLKEPPGQ